MRQLQLYILIFFVINTIQVFSQTRYYDIIVFGDSVGEIKTNKKNISSSEIELSYVSSAKAKILFINTKTFTKASIVFKDNFISNASITRQKNTDIQNISCKWNGKKYTIVDNDKTSFLEEKIYFCTTNFFFKEPNNIFKVYIERLQTYVVIEHLGNHQYLTKVDGATNLYSYKNGVLQSLESKKTFSIYMNLRKN